MAAAPFVGHALQAIAGRDRPFHGGGRISGRVGDPVFQHGSAAILKPIGDGMLGFDLAGARDHAAENGQQHKNQSEAKTSHDEKFFKND